MRSVVIYHPMEIQAVPFHSLKEELGLVGKTVFGFHQRNDRNIFSEIPLAAYKKIENSNTHFILLGGSDKHREQARALEISNITFLDYTSDTSRIYSFLTTLDVYAHGRKDGEVNSTAMAEALHFGLPIISHTSDIHNGHVECISNAGVVVNTVDEYAEVIHKLQNDTDYLTTLSENAKVRFNEKYDLQTQIKLIEDLYTSVVKDPFPHPLRRKITAWRLRRFLVYIPMKIVSLMIKKIQKLIKSI